MLPKDKMNFLSIVFSFRNKEDTLPELIRRIHATLQEEWKEVGKVDLLKVWNATVQ